MTEQIRKFISEHKDPVGAALAAVPDHEPLLDLLTADESCYDQMNPEETPSITFDRTSIGCTIYHDTRPILYKWFECKMCKALSYQKNECCYETWDDIWRCGENHGLNKATQNQRIGFYIVLKYLMKVSDTEHVEIRHD